MDWLHLPIRDVSIPDAVFNAAWAKHSAELRKRLRAGENVVVHCRGGLGRAGMIAARLLVDEGVDPTIAVAQVRRARPGAIETSEQEAWVTELAASSTQKSQTRRVNRRDNSEKARGVAPEPSTRSATNPSHDRALGAFVGLAVGDALGTTIGFSSRDTCAPVVDMVGGGPFHLKPGEWTDDTSMALCLSDCLIASGGMLEPSDLACRFLRWLDEGENSVTGRCFDIGITTRAALESFRRTRSPVGDRSARAAGNGGIMRLAPAAVVASADRDRAAALGRPQSEVTHASDECLAAADVLARVLSKAIVGGGLKALRTAEGIEYRSAKVEAIAKSAWRGKGRENIRSTGYVVDTLEAAC